MSFGHFEGLPSSFLWGVLVGLLGLNPQLHLTCKGFQVLGISFSLGSEVNTGA